MLLQDFSSLTGLTNAGSGATFLISTDYVHTGAASLKVTAGAAAATCDFTLPNLTFGRQREPTFLLRYNSPSDASLSSVLLYLSTTAGFSAGTWTSATLTQYDGVRSQATYKSGWNSTLVKRSSFAGGTPAVLDNPSSVFTTCRVRIEANRGPIYWDALYVDVVFRPVAMVMFDDGHASLFTDDVAYGSGVNAFEYMQSLGLSGTMYLDTSLLDQAGYVTTAQVQSLYDAGWDIGNHTHGSLTVEGASDAALDSALNQCDAMLASHAWERGRKHFAYPTGAFTLDTDPARLRSRGFYTARSIQATLLNTPYAPDNLHHLWAKGINSGASLLSVATMTAKVDEAIQTGRMFGAYIHALGADSGNGYTWPHASFKALIDYIHAKSKAGLIDCTTISQWYDGLAMPRSASGARVAA